MRFWQKTYLLTLALFLLCLNAGIFSLAAYTFRKNADAVENACLAEYDYMARSFEKDCETLLSAGGGEGSSTLLMQAYGIHYAGQEIKLAFYEDGGNVIYSLLPEETALPSPDTVTWRKLSGVRHLVICSTVNESCHFVYAKNVSSLDREFSSLLIIFAGVAGGASAALAVCLYFVLKKLSLPLERLRQTTESIAAGDLSMTADESGSDELAMLAGSFNIMVGRLREQMEMLEKDACKKQMLVDNMAHELRTPLTVIHGYAEAIEKAALPEKTKIEAAKCILSEAERLRKISEKILDTAYIRECEIAKEKVDLAKLLSDTAVRLSGKAEQRGVILRFEGGASASAVQGDVTLLSMLFSNLTENAVKACSPGGRVTLYCKDAAATVIDNGKGMTKEQLSHITEPFYRTDKSRSRAEGGAGLGLALCRQIVQAHGAKMSFSSEEGKGTAVSVEFTT